MNGPYEITKSGGVRLDIDAFMKSDSRPSVESLQRERPSIEVPDGWQLVPIKATYEMTFRGMQAARNAINGEDEIDRWRKMLEVAPKYKADDE